MDEETRKELLEELAWLYGREKRNAILTILTSDETEEPEAAARRVVALLHSKGAS